MMPIPGDMSLRLLDAISALYGQMIENGRLKQLACRAHA